jgi:hypothetical protein
MLGYDINGNIDWNEVADMEFEQAQGSKEQIIERMDQQDYAIAQLNDCDKEQWKCGCKFCRDAKRILGI